MEKNKTLITDGMDTYSLGVGYLLGGIGLMTVCLSAVNVNNPRDIRNCYFEYKLENTDDLSPNSKPGYVVDLWCDMPQGAIFYKNSDACNAIIHEEVRRFLRGERDSKKSLSDVKKMVSEKKTESASNTPVKQKDKGRSI